jgi:hypothetical protein
MKTKSRVILSIIFIALLVSNCQVSPMHSIRIQNSFAEDMSAVNISSVAYGRVNSGAITDYKPANEGSLTISGSTVSGRPLSGSGSINGKGVHKWTITITSAGGVGIIEDK